MYNVVVTWILPPYAPYVMALIAEKGNSKISTLPMTIHESKKHKPPRVAYNRDDSMDEGQQE